MSAITHTFDRLPGDHSSYITDDPQGAVRLARLAAFVGVDTETGSARTAGRWELSAFTVASTTTAYVLHPERHREAIKDVLAYARRMIFHNAAYDLPVLVASGLLHPSRIAKVSDTLITARMIWPDARADSNSLGALADRVLGAGYAALKSALEDGWKAITGKSKAAMFNTLNLDNSQAFAAYAAFDPLVTARLYQALTPWLHAALNPCLPGFRAVDAAELDAREQTVNRVLVRRSALGLGWDNTAVDSVIMELTELAAEHRMILTAAGLDPDLPATELKRSLLSRLDAEGRIPSTWPRLKDGNLTTSQTWMSRLDDNPLAHSAHDLLQAQRWIRDYAEGTVPHLFGDRVRPQVGVGATTTGRMTYGSPNLQQLPGPVRRIYAFDRPATSFDWSSIEPVVAAALARDPAVWEPYEAGADLYEPVAERAGVARKTAKVVILAQLYGQGLTSLAFALNITEEQARTLVRSVRDSWPGVTRMIERVSWFGSAHGAIQTISGRRIPLPPDFKTGNKTYAGYKAVNYLIQGSAYDLLACSIKRMADDGLADELQLAIHDELVVSTSVADDVQRIMITPPPELVRAANRTPRLRVGRSDLGYHWEDKAS